MKKLTLLLLTFFVILTSCSSKKNYIKEVKCYKLNTIHDTNYEDESDSFIYNQMKDFNSSENKTVDIVRIMREQSYNTTTYFKRIYILNGKGFLVDENKEIELSEKDYHSIKSVFETIENNNSAVFCFEDSSRKVSYLFFVRINGKLIMTFSYDRDLIYLDKYLAQKELKYINLFEQTTKN